MKYLSAQDQLALFDEHDWGCLSDVVVNAGCPELGRSQLRALFAALPESIRSEVVRWGVGDSPTGDNIFVFLRDHPEIRDGLKSAADAAEAFEVADPIPSGVPGADDGSDEASVAWLAPHHVSSELAMHAHAKLREGRFSEAEDLFRQAAGIEEIALGQIDASKHRTFGIVAVSAVSLWHKGKDVDRTLTLAHLCLTNPDLPDDARTQLGDLAFAAYTERRGVVAPSDPVVDRDWRSAVVGEADLSSQAHAATLLAINAELLRLGSGLAADLPP